MLNAILQGVLLGVFLSGFVGITFFVLMETSIRHGFKSAISMSFGVFISDILILLTIWNISRGFILSIANSNIFNVLCSLVFIGFGLYYLINSKSINLNNTVQTGSRTKLFFQGILVNISNPSVIIFWLGAILFAASKLTYNSTETTIYFGSALLVVLFFDLVKIYLASRLKKWLTKKLIKHIYTIAGMLLLIIGLKMLLIIKFF